MSLGRYVKAKKVPSPRTLEAGGRVFHGWTEEEIKHVRKLLPKIANGRKTRWQRQREAEREKQRKSKKKTQPRAAGPHKQRTKKKK